MNFQPASDALAVRQAWCCGRKLTATVGDAGLEIRAVVLILWIAALSVIVVWVRDRLNRDGASSRRDVWLAGWQAGAPLIALTAIAYLAMNFFVAVYAYPPATLADYAHGWAEMALVLWSGLLTSALATFARSSVRRRFRDKAPSS